MNAPTWLPMVGDIWLALVIPYALWGLLWPHKKQNHDQ